MNLNFLIIFCILFIIILLALLYNNREQFMNEIDMNEYNSVVTNAPENTFSYAQQEIIIPPENSESNFPLNKELNVVDPIPTYPVILPNQAFKDNFFVRDIGVNKALEQLTKRTADDYKNAANSQGSFMVPKDSKDLITNTNYEDIPKTQRDNMYIVDIYDMMIGKIDQHISQDELNNIIGKPIIYDDITNMYNPVFTSIDPDQTSDMFKNIQYKFTGYSPVPLGSML